MITELVELIISTSNYLCIYQLSVYNTHLIDGASNFISKNWSALSLRSELYSSVFNIVLTDDHYSNLRSFSLGATYGSDRTLGPILS